MKRSGIQVDRNDPTTPGPCQCRSRIPLSLHPDYELNSSVFFGIGYEHPTENISAAMSNPNGPDRGSEWVESGNASDVDANLDGHIL